MSAKFNPFTGNIDFVGSSGVAIGDTIGNSPTVNGVLFSDGGVVGNDRLLTTDGMFFGAVPYVQMSGNNVPNASLNFIDASAFGVGQGFFVGLPDTVGIFQIGKLSDFSAYFRIISNGSGSTTATLYGRFVYDGTTNIPNLVDHSGSDNNFEYYIGRIDNTHSITGRDTFSFHVNTAKSFGWYSSSYTKLMELTGGSGLLYIPSVASGGTAPTTSGTTKMLITDSNGLISFDNLPTGGVSIGDAVGNSPVAKGVFFDDGSGNFVNDAHFLYDASTSQATFKRYDNTTSSNILQILTESNAELVTFRTSNPSGLTDFTVTAPGGSYGINFQAGSNLLDGWNIAGGYNTLFYYNTGTSQTILALIDTGQVGIGAWNFSTLRGWVSLYNGDSGTVSAAVVNAASQSVDSFRVTDSSGGVQFAVAKNGAIKPPSLADSAAENSTLYYSTTANKLVWKDSGGTVNNLY